MPSEVEFSMASDARTEASISADGVEVSSGDTKGYINEVDKAGGRVGREDDRDAAAGDSDPNAEDLEGGDGGDQPEDGGDDREDADPGALTDIETFDPQDPENVEAWNKEYVKEDGFLDIDRISSEFWRNVGKGETALNDATYAFLESKGISRADAKRYEAMAINERDAQASSIASHDQKLFDIAGSPEALREALEWGKGGGYTEAQRKKFDTLLSGKDFEAKQEAIELLMGRYQKTDAYRQAREGEREAAKPREPLRDATRGQGGGKPSAKPFKDRAEWRAARKAAGDDPAKLRQVDQRAKASRF